jgi:carbamoyltransferase
MKIISIHDGHNAAACLLVDGKIQFAIEEERLTHIKNHSTFPSNSIDLLLKYCNLKITDIDYFVFSSNHIPDYKDRNELMLEYKESSSICTYLKRAAKRKLIYNYVVKSRTDDRIKMALAHDIKREQIIFVAHHLSHASAAYFASPWWRNEKVLVLTNDGGGDGLCATVSIGEKGKLTRLASVPVSESLGYFYSMITFLLGMVPEEHEYKVMGLAPYSHSSKYNHLLEKFNSLFSFEKSDKGITWKRSNGCPHTQYSYHFFKKLIELERFDIVAGAVQEFLENFLTKWISNCIKATGIHKVALSGGIFLNVKANKKILELNNLEELFIYPSCGDPTNSMGASYYTYYNKCRTANVKENLEALRDLYFGPGYSDPEIEIELRKTSYKFHLSKDVEKETANLLQNHDVVARFKDRMEFGARALGNRSILAHPSDRNAIKTINEMIKNRDFWMPFAPSIISDKADEYMINPKKMESSYMIMSFDTKIDHDKIYSASHPYDKTIRPQIVKQDWNPDYYKLIKYFEELSGIGAVLNTSFNLHGYPIVCSPEDALYVFSNSGLKYLAIGNYLVSK